MGEQKYPAPSGGGGVAIPKYDTQSDVPDDLEPGTIVYVRDESTHYFEDGT